MALDVGEKRIGIALSDFLHVIATPHSFISRKPEEEAIEQIKKIAKENRVETIVVGLPINMDGTQGHQAQDCLGFAEKLKDFFKIVMDSSVFWEKVLLTYKKAFLRTLFCYSITC